MFKNTFFFETVLSDHHHLIYSLMKTTFKSEKLKKFIYHEYSNFSSECFKDDFMPSICQEKYDYSDFVKIFPDTLNKNAPKKIKTFQGIQKPHINKTLGKAIMTDRSSKTRQTKLET